MTHQGSSSSARKFTRPTFAERLCGYHGTLFRVNKVCPACGFQIEREGDEGFYLGSMSLNFGFTLVCFLTPVLLLAYFKVIGATVAMVLAGAGAFLVPVLVYRASRSWWLMNYYILFPHHLPANGGSNE
jgi:hypothetical protein